MMASVEDIPLGNLAFPPCEAYIIGITPSGDNNFHFIVNHILLDDIKVASFKVDANLIKNLHESFPELSFIQNINKKEVGENIYKTLLSVDADAFKQFKKALFIANGAEINGKDLKLQCYKVIFDKYVFNFSLGAFVHSQVLVFSCLLPLPEENNTSSGSASTSANVSAETIKQALKEVLEEENSDLIRVIKDCPYIPIRSLNGTDGAVYKDGEFIYLDKIGKTFKVLGSFHIVKDTDLNLATCYALGIDSKEPSLILPELILNQLKGGG